MTTTPTPPVVPPEDPDGRDSTTEAAPDSAEADRLASQGEGTGAVDDLAADPDPDSAEADRTASMGGSPETD
jgi:hypothetical protein